MNPLFVLIEFPFKKYFCKNRSYLTVKLIRYASYKKDSLVSQILCFMTLMWINQWKVLKNVRSCNETNALYNTKLKSDSKVGNFRPVCYGNVCGL